MKLGLEPASAELLADATESYRKRENGTVFGCASAVDLQRLKTPVVSTFFSGFVSVIVIRVSKKNRVPLLFELFKLHTPAVSGSLKIHVLLSCLFVTLIIN